METQASDDIASRIQKLIGAAKAPWVVPVSDKLGGIQLEWHWEDQWDHVLEIEVFPTGEMEVFCDHPDVELDGDGYEFHEHLDEVRRVAKRWLS